MSSSHSDEESIGGDLLVKIYDQSLTKEFDLVEPAAQITFGGFPCKTRQLRQNIDVYQLILTGTET